MSCKACTSGRQRSFPSEINIHFPGICNATKPTVWAFPSLLVCLNCGFTEFSLSKTEVKELGLGNSATTGLRFFEHKAELSD